MIFWAIQELGGDGWTINPRFISKTRVGAIAAYKNWGAFGAWAPLTRLLEPPRLRWRKGVKAGSLRCVKVKVEEVE
jgi:hypothetical protein